MSKKYRTYSRTGAFSDFQIRVPDQTEKFDRQTKQNIKGKEAAQRFLEGNREIYLSAQRLVNQVEDENRQTNFDLQTKERQAYRNALERDYKIGIDNLERENKANLTNLKNIQSFSATATQVIGQYLEEEEKKKVAAAHDVILRAGITYPQLVAFQKLNDNLDRSEFAAQDSIQQMFGPDADTTLIDAMFTVYQNRHTKRWQEHKQLLFNTLNKYPEFLEQKLAEIREKEGAEPTNFDAALTQIQREFVELNFLGAKPEVLSGAGVYAELTRLTGNRRGTLLQNRRNVQAQEFQADRIRAFSNAYSQEGIAGLIKHNSTNPSYTKRMDLVAMVEQHAKVVGNGYMSSGDIQDLLDYPMGGSNGKTLEEAFQGTPFIMRLHAARDAAVAAERKAREVEDQALQNQIDDFVANEANRLGADGELSADDYNDVAYALDRAFPGATSEVLDRLKRVTPDAQLQRLSKRYLDDLESKGLLTVEEANRGVYASQAEYDKRLTAAKTQEQLFGDKATQLHIGKLRSTFESDDFIQEFKKDGLNEFNYKLALNDYIAQYKAAVVKHSANPANTMDIAREKAFQEVRAIMVDEISKLKTTGGEFPKFSQPDKTYTAEELGRSAKAGDVQLKNIRGVIVDKTLTEDQRFKKIATMINGAELEKALTNYSNRNWTMPPIVKQIAQDMGRTDLFVLTKLADHVSDDAVLAARGLNEEQRKVYGWFEASPYKPLRVNYPTSARIGRANVGDSKTGTKAPIRPSMFKVVQYVSADPAIKGKDDGPGGRIYYDAVGHGGRHYHNHYEFESREQAARAKALFEAQGFRVTSYLRPEDKDSAHFHGVAIDVAPPLDLPYTDEAEARWSASANAVIGFTPLEDE